jgi:hypothetical protein
MSDDRSGRRMTNGLIASAVTTEPVDLRHRRWQPGPAIATAPTSVRGAAATATSRRAWSSRTGGSPRRRSRSAAHAIYCSWIDKLPPEVVKQQGSILDYVSGATDSSDAFDEAIAEALAQGR